MYTLLGHIIRNTKTCSQIDFVYTQLSIVPIGTDVRPTTNYLKNKCIETSLKLLNFHFFYTLFVNCACIQIDSETNQSVYNL